MELEERQAQTAVKHEILDAYLRKWGPIITNGLNSQYVQRPNKPRETVRFMYVDYSSFMGAYQYRGKTVDGSPLIGIKALDDLRLDFAKTTGSSAMTNVLLFEKIPKTFDSLVGVLKRANYGPRLKRIDKGETLNDGDIGLYLGDSSALVPRILTFIDRIPKTYSLHFIDPFGIKSVKRSNIEQISTKRGADCIINLMLNTVTRFMGGSQKDNLNAGETAHVESFDELFGVANWRQIARDVQNGAIMSHEAETRLSQLFYDLLKSADNTLHVKQIPLKFEGKDQLLYQLFLTTHNAYGSLAMNKILTGAKVRAHDYRRNKRELDIGQQSFFGANLAVDPASPVEEKANLDFLSHEMYSIGRGKTMTYKELLDALADTTAYFEEDMQGALSRLKASGSASFEGGASGLSNRSKIAFP